MSRHRVADVEALELSHSSTFAYTEARQTSRTLVSLCKVANAVSPKGTKEQRGENGSSRTPLGEHPPLDRLEACKCRKRC
jgi:hypothetical protein